MLCRGGAEAPALHFDDSALGFYPGSDVLGSLQVGDLGQRIGDADRRAAARGTPAARRALAAGLGDYGWYQSSAWLPA
jgi:hypothetical protein